MNHHSPRHIDFITQFIDSVTIRPFFDGLRRISEQARPRSAGFG